MFLRRHRIILHHQRQIVLIKIVRKKMENQSLRGFFYPSRIVILICTCLLLCESPMPRNMETQVSACEEVHHEVKIRPILESVHHIYKKAAHRNKTKWVFFLKNIRNEYSCLSEESSYFSFITDWTLRFEMILWLINNIKLHPYDYELIINSFYIS